MMLKGSVSSHYNKETCFLTSAVSGHADIFCSEEITIIENCQVLNVDTKCPARFLVTLKSAFYWLKSESVDCIYSSLMLECLFLTLIHRHLSPSTLCRLLVTLQSLHRKRPQHHHPAALRLAVFTHTQTALVSVKATWCHTQLASVNVQKRFSETDITKQPADRTKTICMVGHQSREVRVGWWSVFIETSWCQV